MDAITTPATDLFTPSEGFYDSEAWDHEFCAPGDGCDACDADIPTTPATGGFAVSEGFYDSEAWDHEFCAPGAGCDACDA